MLSPQVAQDRFIGNFGTMPVIVAVLWRLLKPWVRRQRGYCKPWHLLWTLMFMKTYGTEKHLASFVGADEKTWRKWVWYMLEGIHNLSPKVVSFMVCCCLKLYVIFSHSPSSRSNLKTDSINPQASPACLLMMALTLLSSNPELGLDLIVHGTHTSTTVLESGMRWQLASIVVTSAGIMGHSQLAVMLTSPSSGTS